jgi:hypothetical protein
VNEVVEHEPQRVRVRRRVGGGRRAVRRISTAQRYGGGSGRAVVSVTVGTGAGVVGTSGAVVTPGTDGTVGAIGGVAGVVGAEVGCVGGVGGSPAVVPVRV